jgi:multicomponent K+:H+ antiporter subunit D
MNHWIIVPVVLPALLAPLIAFVMRHDIVLARSFSTAGTAALAAVAVGLTLMAAGGQTHVYELGNWPAPFGIVLVLDRLSAMMVLLTAVLGMIVLAYAIGTGWDRRGQHFHALFQFQLMGICGAFVTGDIFNLFVFFEVLLIASYGLMIHGGGKDRLRAGLQYVIMNLAGSTLFLFALGTIYATTGTLNIADLAQRVQEIPAEDSALVRVAAVLLMVVFAVKAALFPVQFWLPGTYSNAPAPVAALFAIMTKVGAYAVLRVYAIVFPPETAATGALPAGTLMVMALVTLAVGALGVLGARRLLPLVSFSVLGSMGTLFIALAGFAPETTVAALFYLVHSTFAAAALFLVADLVVSQRGEAADRLVTAPPAAQNGLLAALFFAGAIAMTGMPPLSGFLGKLLILDAVRPSDHAVLLWTAILLTSLLTIVGFARAGSVIFWKSTELVGTGAGAGGEAPPRAPGLALAAIGAIMAAFLTLTVLAGPATAYLEQAAAQLHDPADYIEAVLSRAAGGS